MMNVSLSLWQVSLASILYYVSVAKEPKHS